MQLLIALQNKCDSNYEASQYQGLRDDVQNCNNFIIKTEYWDWAQVMMFRDTDCVIQTVWTII